MGKTGYNAGYEPENHVVLNFDLTDMNSVSQIVMGMKRTGENVALPKNLKIKVSYNNSDWFTLKDFGRETPSDDVIWDGAVDEFGASIENADMAYTRYIRIEFDLTEGSATCLDEVQILANAAKLLLPVGLWNPMGTIITWLWRNLIPSLLRRLPLMSRTLMAAN